MMKWSKAKTVVFLFIPLLFSSITTYIVYTGHFKNYHEKVDVLIKETTPDYSFVITEEPFILEPDFDKEAFLKQFKLDLASSIGRVRCNLTINSRIYNTFIFWAPDDYFLNYSSLPVTRDLILLDETIANAEGIGKDLPLSLNVSCGNDQIIVSTEVSSYISFRDIFAGDVLPRDWEERMEVGYLFLLSETFENLFGNFFNQHNIEHLLLFDFSAEELKSYLPQQLPEILAGRRIAINTYCNILYNENDGNYRTVVRSLLEDSLSNFNVNFNEYTWARVAVFYIICVGFSIVVITNTSRGFFSSQKEKIEFYYLRGSKKSDFLKDFLKLESKLFFGVLLGGFLSSTFTMGIFQPRMLTFGYNYGVNLLFASIVAIFYCFIQYLVAVDSLSIIYKRNKEKEVTMYNKILRGLINNLQWIVLGISFAVSFYLFLSTGNEEIELSIKALYAFILAMLFVMLIIISKRVLIWLGGKFVWGLSIFSDIGKYTLRVSKKVIKNSSLIIQMLILFGFVCSFFVVGVDTIDHYNQINMEYNSLGDIIIETPKGDEELVKLQIENLTDAMISIDYVVSSMSYEIEENDFVSYGLKLFLLNSSTISQLFSLENIEKRYSGLREPHQIAEELIDNWNMSITNKAFAEYTSAELNDIREISLPIIDNTSFLETKSYDVTILDIVDFAPFFSGIEKERPFMIMNEEFFSSKTPPLDIKSSFQIVWLKNDVTVQSFENRIKMINQGLVSNIEIITHEEVSLLTDDYWESSVLETLFLSLFSVLIVGLVAFFYGFYSDAIKLQIHNFRTFFAQGLSIKKGVFYSVLPIFLFTLGYILLGFLLGLAFLAVVLTSIQPEYYLKVPLSIFPYSFSLFMGQIILLVVVLSLSGLVAYRKLQKEIPTVDRIVFTVFDSEGDLYEK